MMDQFKEKTFLRIYEYTYFEVNLFSIHVPKNMAYMVILQLRIKLKKCESLEIKKNNKRSSK